MFSINWRENDIFTKQERENKINARLDDLGNSVVNLVDLTQNVSSRLTEINDKFENEYLKVKEEKVVAEDLHEVEEETLQVPEFSETVEDEHELDIVYTDGYVEEIERGYNE